VPAPASRALALPSSVVIDLTTWNTTRERSRLPVDCNTGNVDIILTPDGRLVPTSVYSCPSSLCKWDSFLPFWITDRGDLFDPATSAYPQLPLLEGLAPNARNNINGTVFAKLVTSGGSKLPTFVTGTSNGLKQLPVNQDDFAQ
jgi:hypothetical protein